MAALLSQKMNSKIPSESMKVTPSLINPHEDSDNEAASQSQHIDDAGHLSPDSHPNESYPTAEGGPLDGITLVQNNTYLPGALHNNPNFGAFTSSSFHTAASDNKPLRVQ
jgi:hypothetical protein